MLMKQRAEINRLQAAPPAEAPKRKRDPEPEMIAASAEEASKVEKAVELSELTPLQRAIAAEFVL